MKKKSTKERNIFAGISLALFIIITISIIYLFSMSSNTIDLAFSYVAGISMIVLPCTLPLAFIIVPLSIGKGYKKGLGMALMFGLGLSITIAVYGVVVGLIGNIIGLDDAISKAGVVSKVLFMVGGGAALLFGLSELGLLKFNLPSFARTPKFIEKRKDYAKALFLGLFLGNAGVGCPNPLFYLLLGDIAVKGSVLFGGWMGFVHGVGRATPLIFLSILGILGINATSSIMKHITKVKKVIGWSLVVLGAVIFIIGGAHEWYEESIVHGGWNEFVEFTGMPAEFEAEEHGHEGPGDFISHRLAPWLLLLLILIPIVWYYIKKKKISKDNQTMKKRK
ncbi:cytochrome C biogenesis protein [Candidatus Woesearchaeota archaeon]|nr:cytochrome C biogenesis protein [Candidatus Woesearchaeota archaeon]